MAEPEQDSLDYPKPEGVYLILDDGARVKCDVKCVGLDHGFLVYNPVIEGDLAILMHAVRSVHVEVMPANVALRFPVPIGREIPATSDTEGCTSVRAEGDWQQGRER